MSDGQDRGRPPLEDENQDPHRIAMNSSLWTALTDYAKELNMSVSAVIRSAAKSTLKEAGRWTDEKGSDAD